MSTRTEHDLLGYLEVPADAYYGVHTARAVDNFPITGIKLAIYPAFIAALAAVKQAAATANRDIGALDATKADAIIAAAQEIRAGRLHEQFVVDMIQGGAGTSTNMNANEVIANRALETPRSRPRRVPAPAPAAGREPGPEHQRRLPDRHQHRARRLRGRSWMPPWVCCTRPTCARPSSSRDVLKMGRTQLQDAVPMTLGQEFGAFASTLAEDRERLREARALLHEINLGGTAIGTELNAHPEYRRHVVAELRRITGIDTLVSATDLVEATSDVGHFVQLSGVLKRVAVKLSKICNDLRLLSSGPAGRLRRDQPARAAGRLVDHARQGQSRSSPRSSTRSPSR